MHIPASFHLTDALYGLATGTVAAAVAIGWSLRHRHRSTPDETRESLNAPTIALAAAAGLVAMYLARAVRDGLVEDISPGPAVAIVVVGTIAGFGWAWAARLLAPAWISSLVVLSAFGVWAAVPDTETAVAVLGAWLPFALWAAASGRSSPTTPVAYTPWWVLAWIALATVLAWAAVWGADAEPASLPGALACFGIALVVPWVVAGLDGKPPAGWWVLTQLAAVIVASRWAAAASSTGTGVVRSLVLLAVLGAVVAVSSRWTARALPPRSDRREHRR